MAEDRFTMSKERTIMLARLAAEGPNLADVDRVDAKALVEQLIACDLIWVRHPDGSFEPLAPEGDEDAEHVLALRSFVVTVTNEAQATILRVPRDAHEEGRWASGMIAEWVKLLRDVQDARDA